MNQSNLQTAEEILKQVPVGETVHIIKCWEEFMQDVATGKKNFEVRKNDRDYRENDYLVMQGWDNENKKYTGKWVIAEITYFLGGGQFGIEEGYCVIGIKVTNYNFKK